MIRVNTSYVYNNIRVIVFNLEFADLSINSKRDYPILQLKLCFVKCNKIMDYIYQLASKVICYSNLRIVSCNNIWYHIHDTEEMNTLFN